MDAILGSTLTLLVLAILVAIIARRFSLPHTVGLAVHPDAGAVIRGSGGCRSTMVA
jgi:hypothetical protein